jgi:hypothetical protein
MLETISSPMTWSSNNSSKWTQLEPVMNSHISDSEPIDRKTSRSICDAIGERLQQALRPDSLRLSTHLEHLMDELRKRDREGHRELPN